MTRGAISGWCVFMLVAANWLIGIPLAHAQSTLPATVATMDRPAPPTGTALHLAERQLEELRTRSGRRYTPADLLKLASESSSELKYVAALASMREAAANRRVSIAQQARDILVRSFDIQPLKIDLLLAKSLADAQLAVSAVVAVRSIERALADGDMGTAREVSSLLANQVAGLPEPLASCSKDCLADVRMAASLQSRASSQSESSSAGLFECLYRGRWKQNLMQLAAGQGDLAVCARKDIDAGDLRSRFTAAETWWLTGQGKTSIDGWRIAGRAIQIYDEILPQLTGVDRELVVSRKSEHLRRRLARTGYLPGVRREVTRNGVRTHEQCTSLDLPKDAEGIPKSDARVIYRGLLLVEHAGRYELTFAGGSGMRIVIDSNELMNNPTAYRKRSGEKLGLDLAEGLHNFEIELWSNSSKPRLSVKWSTPLHPEAQIIPASALFTDPLSIDP